MSNKFDMRNSWKSTVSQVLAIRGVGTYEATKPMTTPLFVKKINNNNYIGSFQCLFFLLPVLMKYFVS